MALQYHPGVGEVLMCDFSEGFKPPEITKKRPVVVLSPRRRRAPGLYTVVPLSTSRPYHVEPYHHLLDARGFPQRLAENENWAKCDLLYTVSLDRLDRIYAGRQPNGKRIYLGARVTPVDLEAIRQCVLSGLGIEIP